MAPSCRDESGAYLIDRRYVPNSYPQPWHLLNLLHLPHLIPYSRSSPKYFEPLLNYLRTGNLIIDPNVSWLQVQEQVQVQVHVQVQVQVQVQVKVHLQVSAEGVLEEARYFGLESLLPRLEGLVAQDSTPR